MDTCFLLQEEIYWHADVKLLPNLAQERRRRGMTAHCKKLQLWHEFWFNIESKTHFYANMKTHFAWSSFSYPGEFFSNAKIQKSMTEGSFTVFDSNSSWYEETFFAAWLRQQAVWWQRSALFGCAQELRVCQGLAQWTQPPNIEVKCKARTVTALCCPSLHHTSS